jgi:hypothetical protein
LLIIIYEIFSFIFVIRGHVKLAWGLGITFHVVIGAAFNVLVVRLRRRTQRPIQLAEVSF